MVARCERKHAVQVVALYPILQLTRLVASIGADFEHGNDHYLDFNRTRFGMAGRCKNQKQKRG